MLSSVKKRGELGALALVADERERLEDRAEPLHGVSGAATDVRELLEVGGHVALVPGDEDRLDVGCGTGTLALAARRRLGTAGAVHGVDASPEMVARARSKSARLGLPVVFQVAAAQSLPFADATFDAVFCTLAMHHLPEDARARALAEMRRVLKPQGRVLVVEFRRAQGMRALFNPVTLLHTFRSPRIFDDLEALVKRAGFERVETGDLGVGGLGYVLSRRGGDA